MNNTIAATGTPNTALPIAILGPAGDPSLCDDHETDYYLSKCVWCVSLRALCPRVVILDVGKGEGNLYEIPGRSA
ncbi:MULTISPECIES: hypothetical protein [Pseudomonas]|jgi:hypothetical protein|uniref:Uncharacterized protein n=1 Tax=Pseudomonas siliginis TaxID=2842346 RepID=A0ABY5CDI0_9PSED|nr:MULTISPECIES: hypothetical protein [Pseudomonas]UST74716.1 hypothetical protein NF675_01095 [Pseudomonas siliginis]UST85310.1 hypothetical protein NF677_01095 [Pseudomonas siliginis]UVL94762.1 hypothetical protein LOY48_01110 [Pseudomonas siliginis]WLG62734.1 hypothetical protein PSH90_01100 [Pseudomonas sp. FP1762]